jgi:transposase-like protein
VQEVVQQVLEAEMDEAVGAEKSARTPQRVGYRAGYYGRMLVTRVGKLELRVPQDRQGRFRTEVFERYQRSEKALVGALTEMYVQGVSTRKVKAVTEELCGHEFSASTISRLNQNLDEELCRAARKAIAEVFAEASWQRCYVHFLRNALDYLPRKTDNDCLTELRWIYDRRSIEEARQDLAAWLKKWTGRYPKLCDWVEGNIEETLTFYRLPRQHHKNLKSTNLLERLNEEIKRRTLVVRISPNTAACLRLIGALAVETHENWIEAIRYLNMEYLKEHKKELMRRAA